MTRSEHISEIFYLANQMANFSKMVQNQIMRSLFSTVILLTVLIFLSFQHKCRADFAPEIANKGIWINTDKELTLKDLRGKVVLIEFWTFGCYNCTNTIPYLNGWYEKYKEEGLEIIGIHCPEFDHERDFENLKDNVISLGIRYPVLTDNAFLVWRRYDVHAWPTIFLIDKKGEIRFKKIGEGKYDKTESMIKELLEE